VSDSPDRPPGPADAKRAVARFLKLIVFATALALMGITILLGWGLEWRIAILLVALITVLYFEHRNATDG